MRTRHFTASIAIVLGAAATSAHAVTTVDLELALLVDVSGSISRAEFDLQRQGYANAFDDAGIQASIAGGRSLAATLVYWSGTSQQAQVVGWTLIDSAASASSFASAILAAPRTFSGGTNPNNAIDFAVPLFASNDFDGVRQVIDVSGDGQGNAASTSAARNAALAAGIDQLNGLPILGSDPSLLAFYQNNVQGGAGSFTQAASGFADFDDAVRLKIGREIVGPIPAIPEPETYAMLLLGLGVIGFVSRRRKSLHKN